MHDPSDGRQRQRTLSRAIMTVLEDAQSQDAHRRDLASGKQLCLVCLQLLCLSAAVTADASCKVTSACPCVSCFQRQQGWQMALKPSAMTGAAVHAWASGVRLLPSSVVVRPHTLRAGAAMYQKVCFAAHWSAMAARTGTVVTAWHAHLWGQYGAHERTEATPNAKLMVKKVSMEQGTRDEQYARCVTALHRHATLHCQVLAGETCLCPCDRPYRLPAGTHALSLAIGHAESKVQAQSDGELHELGSSRPCRATFALLLLKSSLQSVLEVMSIQQISSGQPEGLSCNMPAHGASGPHMGKLALQSRQLQAGQRPA